MSDFSELCPLFNTGVYNELTIDQITMSGCSTTMNALGGIAARAGHPGSFKFGRTVVVTKIYAKKLVTGTAASIFLLATRMATSGSAAMTVFASLEMSITVTVHCVNRYRAMTQAANQTFLAADVLGFSAKTKKTNGGKFGFIVRYKEK